MPLSDAGPMSLDARRRRAAGLMAAQFDRATPQDTEVVERSGLLPLGTYANGMTGLAFPGLMAEPVAGFVAEASNPVPYLSRSEDERRQAAERGFNVAGAAMAGGLAAPKPKAGAVAPKEQPLVGYRGSAYGERSQSPTYWASSNPELAADYAAHSYGPAGPSVTPAEFRFKNPLEIDAGGGNWQNIQYNGQTMITDNVARQARRAGHDGVIFRNVIDEVNGNMTPADTIAALQPGTVYSTLTGELLYANGGRPGAAVGQLFQQYGYGAPFGALPDYRDVI